MFSDTLANLSLFELCVWVGRASSLCSALVLNHRSQVGFVVSVGSPQSLCQSIVGAQLETIPLGSLAVI